MNRDELLRELRKLSETELQELLDELRKSGGETSYELIEMSELEGRETTTRVKFLDKKSPRPVEAGEEENIDEMVASAGPLEPDFDSPEMTTEAPAGSTTIYGPTLSGGQLASAIARDFGTVCTSGDVYISDGTYFLYPDSEIRKVLDETMTDLHMWISQYYDCDDFAQVVAGLVNDQLKGSPFGVLWFRGPNYYHAVNAYYSKDQRKMKVVEPQTDAIYDFNKSKYCPQLVVI